MSNDHEGNGTGIGSSSLAIGNSLPISRFKKSLLLGRIFKAPNQEEKRSRGIGKSVGTVTSPQKKIFERFFRRII